MFLQFLGQPLVSREYFVTVALSESALRLARLVRKSLADHKAFRL
jgi:hypothetical protein